MAAFFHALQLLLIFVPTSLLFVSSQSQQGIGVNYGQVADNLPAPPRAAELIKSLNIKRVKIYDTNPDILAAFANSDVEVTVTLGNQYLQTMSDEIEAQNWVKQNLVPFIGRTKIPCIIVGNEVLGDPKTTSFLLPTMRAVQKALIGLGINGLAVTTAHSFSIMARSYPPSSGSFGPDMAQYIGPILDFLSQTNSPFLVNIYPFSAYKVEPNKIPLEYVLFQGSSTGITDPVTNLKYDNMLYAQIDAVYFAIKAMGYEGRVRVQVSETGWPSTGDADETGASIGNAALYNGNLFARVGRAEGTPASPGSPVDVFIFALFNEDSKPGPISERNYGLFYPNGTPVYSIAQSQSGDFPGNPIMTFSGSHFVKVIFNSILLLISLIVS